MVRILSLIFFYSSLLALEPTENTGKRRLTEYPNFFFVEAGTGVGHGIQEAIDSGMFNIYFSMDINTKYQKNPINNPNITFEEGDVGASFSNFISLLYLPATFWLDAIFSPVTAQLLYDSGVINALCPLLNTLDQIKASPIKTHTIMINSIQYISEAYNIPLSTIENKLYEINPYYHLEYIQAGDGGIIVESNCLVATPP